MCVGKLCVSKLCVDKLCVDKLCVVCGAAGAGRTRAGRGQDVGRTWAGGRNKNPSQRCGESNPEHRGN